MDKDCIALMDKLESGMKDLMASFGLLACRAKNMTQAEFNREGDRLAYREEDLYALFYDLYDRIEREVSTSILRKVDIIRLLADKGTQKDIRWGWLNPQKYRKELKLAVDAGDITVREALDLDIAYLSHDTTDEHSIPRLTKYRRYIGEYPEEFEEKDLAWCDAFDRYVSKLS